MSYTNGIIGPQLSGISETSVAGASSTSRAESRPTLRPENRTALNGTDDAKLSTTAGVIAEAITGSDVRSAKVAAVQHSIMMGTYSVSSSELADKLMNVLLQ